VSTIVAKSLMKTREESTYSHSEASGHDYGDVQALEWRIGSGAVRARMGNRRERGKAWQLVL
jgi:hypothetical protein